MELKKSRALTDSEKYYLLTKHFVPSSNYVFPTTLYGNKPRSFQRSSIEQHNGLVYSETHRGAYCKYCVLFGENHDSRINEFGVLVTTPLTNWKKATSNSGKLHSHFNKSQYHARAVEFADNFIQTMSGKAKAVTQHIESTRTKQVKENRSKLISIADAIVTCGRQGIALRGHRDDSGDVASDPSRNHGNFLALLQYRVRGGDSILQEHLMSCAGNARYTSKTIQNELITIGGDLIRESILDEIKEARFFAVIADEATDSSNSEQLAISVRFVDSSSKPQECFLGFSECSSGVSGEAIAGNILSNLRNWKLDPNDLRGQAYDGAGAMAGATKGAAARILQQYPKALFMHCAAHKLNLCVVKCCSILEVSNAMEFADSIVRFFDNSPK